MERKTQHTLFFKILDTLVGNRVPVAVELEGLDVPEMGVAGYAEELPTAR